MRLAIAVGSGALADGVALGAWRLAQEFWGKGRGLVPKEIFDKLEYASAMIDAGLADVRGSFVYVRGCSEYLEWHAEKREQAIAAGKKSAEVRRQKSGSAQPKGGKGQKKTEREPNAIRTDVNGTEPSDSDSDSDSGSSSDKVAILEKSRPVNPVSFYCDLWREKTGVSPDIRGKEAGQLKKFAEDLGIDRACEVMRAYFSMPDPYFIKRGYDVGTMITSLNAIKQFEANGKIVTKKVVEHIETEVDKIQGTARNKKALDDLIDQREREKNISLIGGER